MNKTKLSNRVFNILYVSYKSNRDYQAKAFDNLKNKAGSDILHELIQELRNMGWTNYNSVLGSQEDLMIICGNHVTSINAIKYVENLNKPFWKKLPVKIVSVMSIFFSNLAHNCQYFANLR